MKIYRRSDLESYEPHDWLLERLTVEARGNDADYTTHKWLLDSLPKRMIFADLYGDLLDCRGLRVLDIGGGYSSLGRALAERHDYTLVEIMAHDEHEEFARLATSSGVFWQASDWLGFAADGHYDVIIANDLFPNVDQRLDQFILRYKDLTDELRISLTFYNEPRWYTVRRVDADEVFAMMAWDGAQVERCLSNHLPADAIADLASESESLFPNGRHIARVTFER
ncbi:MAG: class I SAM-dependent methyltransferase [Acidobacteriota bacterium]